MKRILLVAAVSVVVLGFGASSVSANDFYWRDHLKTAVKYSEQGDAAIAAATEAAENNDQAKMCRYLAEAQEDFELAYDKVQRALDTQTTDTTLSNYQSERSEMGSIKSSLSSNIGNAKRLRNQYCS